MEVTNLLGNVASVGLDAIHLGTLQRSAAHPASWDAGPRGRARNSPSLSKCTVWVATFLIVEAQ